MKYRLIFILFLFISMSACKKNGSEICLEYVCQFNTSMNLFEQKNNLIYNEFDYLLVQYRPKIEPWYKKMIAVKDNKKKLTNILDGISPNVDSILMIKILNNEKIGNQLNKKTSIKEEDIELIKKNIDAYKALLLSLISVSDSLRYSALIENINKGLFTGKLNEIKAFKSEQISQAELLACLYKLKADITLAETHIISYLSNQFTFDGFMFSNKEVFVVPNSEILPKGYLYRAEIFLAAYDTTNILYYEIEGKEFETKGCKGTYRFKLSEKPGKYSKPGNFMVRSPYTGEIQKIPFKIEYEVLEKN